MSAGTSTKLPRRRTAPRSSVTVRKPMIVVVPQASPQLQRREFVKSLVEYPAALLLFVLALPVMIAAIGLIRATSRGPAIYSQIRVGRAGRVFTIHKLRTMYHDCESLTGPRWALPGDPRITPFGRICRKLHLDELPQLWNVLRGDMSLVGPRPERPEIVAQLRRSIPSYDARHVVRPGITGFAQVHLPPDTNIHSVKNKVAYDRFYIGRFTPGMDLFVYICTALKVVGLKSWYRRPPRRPTDEV